MNSIVNFIWGIADDVLRDVYVRGKYRDVILKNEKGGGADRPWVIFNVLPRSINLPCPFRN